MRLTGDRRASSRLPRLPVRASGHMTALGLAHLTALELAPTALVAEAGEGFAAVALRFIRNSDGRPSDAVGTEAHRRWKRVLDGEGVRVSDIELVQLKPAIDISFALQGCIEAGADLGATAIIALGRLGSVPAHARFAELCQLAASFGLRVDLEFIRWRAMHISQAAAVIPRAGQTNGAILVDAFDLARSAAGPPT